MARLQDFQTVTPTDSDNILIVQATNQGLATVGSTLGAKMDKANPSGTGKLSINRASGSTEGANSVAVGTGTTASANSSFAEGYLTTASGYYSHAEGWKTTASGTESHSEGDGTTASGDYSHSEGMGTIAQRKSQHVFGEYNLADTGGTGVTTKGTYIEIVGNGANTNSRSNARTLDWNGNETLAGGLKIHGDKDVASISSFTQEVTTTGDGLAGISIPSGVAINNIFSVVVQNVASVYLYAFIIKQPSALFVDIRQFNGQAYASQTATVRLFYYVT